MEVKARHVILGAVLIATFSASVDARLYRWVDEQGNVTYSDKVPPEHAGAGRAEFSPQGIQVDEVPPAATPEEIEHQRELERQARQEQRQLEAQREADRILLRAFPVEDDILLARNGKLANFNLNIGVLLNNARRMKERLARLQSDVAARQREGRKVGPSYAAEMANLEQQLQDTYVRILRTEEKRTAIREEYAGYLRRYRELKHLPETQEIAIGQPGTAILPPEVISTCTGEPDCARRWKAARDYVIANAGTPVILQSETLVLTAPAKADGDIGLAVAVVPRDGGEDQWIFLDVECAATPAGRATCGGSDAAAIRSSFSAAVSDDARNEAQTAPAPGPPTPVPGESAATR